MADLGVIGEAYIEPILTSTIPNLPTASTTGAVSLDATSFSPILTLLTPLGTGAYSITGTVKNSSLAFVARTVIAADRDTGIIYDKVTSDPTTGAFTLNVPNVTCVVYCLPDPADGVNAEIFDLIVPT
jgi:hypothetical protein